MNELTYDDITILMEAMDAWTSRSFGGEIMGIMLEAMVGDKGNPEAKAKTEEEKKRKDLVEKEKREREKEIVVLLKAKLIGIKQKMAAGSLIEESK